MIAAVDVYYKKDYAVSACAIFNSRDDSNPLNEYLFKSYSFDKYTPGSFYKRELKPILNFLKKSIMYNLECTMYKRWR